MTVRRLCKMPRKRICSWGRKQAHGVKGRVMTCSETEAAVPQLVTERKYEERIFNGTRAVCRAGLWELSGSCLFLGFWKASLVLELETTKQTPYRCARAHTHTPFTSSEGNPLHLLRSLLKWAHASWFAWPCKGRERFHRSCVMKRTAIEVGFFIQKVFV